MKKVLKVIKSIGIVVFLVLPLVLVVYALATSIAGGVPTFFGYNTSIVVTPSMSDVLPVGTIILSKKYEPGDDLTEGDIITYLGEEDTFKDKLVTHQIIALEEDGETGEITVTTKGTMNASPDPAIRTDMIKSKYVTTIVKLGGLYTLLQKPVGFLCILVVPIVILIAYEIFDFTRAMHSKEEKNEEANSSDQNN